jgi:hypothetical protein
MSEIEKQNFCNAFDLTVDFSVCLKTVMVKNIIAVSTAMSS